MDSYHRQPEHKDCHSGRDCEFCFRIDPNFSKRSPVDRWVQGEFGNFAGSHVSENGYVQHRLLEIAMKRAQMAVDRVELARTA